MILKCLQVSNKCLLDYGLSIIIGLLAKSCNLQLFQGAAQSQPRGQFMVAGVVIFFFTKKNKTIRSLIEEIYNFIGKLPINLENASRLIFTFFRTSKHFSEL